MPFIVGFQGDLAQKGSVVFGCFAYEIRLTNTAQKCYTLDEYVWKEGFAMKEAYEPMELEIHTLPEEDVITASEIVEHDNYFLSFSMFE